MPVINVSSINLRGDDTFCQQQVILPSKGKAEQAVEREIINNIPLLSKVFSHLVASLDGCTKHGE